MIKIKSEIRFAEISIMIKKISESEIHRFEQICLELSAPLYKSADNIGTYNEKRTHRALKRFICDDEACFEVKVGSSVADVLCDGVIYEIQTGSFYPLTKKIKNYLESSEYEVRVVYPIISHRRIVRVDKDTGEVLRSRMSSAKQKVTKILPELIYLSDALCSRRLTFEIIEIYAEEHRYSDEIHRYRKSGKRDSEVFPISIEGITLLQTTEDFASLLPSRLLEVGEFTAAEFMRATAIKNRRAYNALGALCATGVLKKQKDGNAAAKYIVM